MDRHADHEIQELKNRIIEMGGLAEQAIAAALEGFFTGDEKFLPTVRGLETKINRLHMSIDELCVRLLATQQPMGSDLRLVVAAIKINADLERIGDQAINIIGNASKSFRGMQPDVQFRDDLLAMGKGAQHMVTAALNAFVRSDAALAERVIEMDNHVDTLKGLVSEKVVTALEKGEVQHRRGIHLILIARNLEKIGDHASNIAEDVIYARSGKDVRHPTSRSE